MGKHRKPDIPDVLRPYEEGYRKPPKKTQFKVGNTANPKGRPPKTSKPVGEHVEAILLQKVEVTVRGKTKTLTQLEVMLEALVMKAMKGDIKALECVLRLQSVYRDDPSRTIDLAKLEDADRDILESYLEDVQRDRKRLDGSYPADDQEYR